MEWNQYEENTVVWGAHRESHSSFVLEIESILLGLQRKIHIESASGLLVQQPPPLPPPLKELLFSLPLQHV